MPDSLLPAFFSKEQHLQAFDTVMQARLAGIDLSLVLVYLIDSASPVALPYLADQFGISAMSIYKNAPDDDTRRLLIKEAITLRSQIGTRALVKQAIASAGYDPATLVERCGSNPDNGWAVFKLLVLTGGAIDGTAAINLRKLVTEAKNARSSFSGLEYALDIIIDALDISGETVTIDHSLTPISDDLPMPTLTLDGTWLLDGSEELHPGCESVRIILS